MRRLIAILFFLLLPAAAGAQADSVADYLARTAEIVERIAQLVEESGSVPARRVLTEAQSLHARSLEQAAAGHPRLALAASSRARDAAHHAARLARDSRGSEERARARLDRVDELYEQLLERAREADDQLVLRFLGEAQEQAARARDQFRQGNYEMALNLLEPAEALLARAARLLFEGGGAARLEREFERAQALIDRAAENPASGGDLLQSARETLERARRLAADGQLLRALHASRLATRLAAQAAAQAGEPLTNAAVETQLERYDQRRLEIADAVAASSAREAAQVLERADHHRDEARRLLGAGQLEPALRQVKAALDLLYEASELAR